MSDAPRQWDVYRAMLDPVVGSEQAGERPVLVVSNAAVNKWLPIVTVLPLTRRRPGRRIYSFEVLLPAKKAGQPHESIIMAHQVRTIARERLGAQYGRLEDEGLHESVRVAIRRHFDLS